MMLVTILIVDQACCEAPSAAAAFGALYDEYVIITYSVADDS
jgi:hypothetical protein